MPICIKVGQSLKSITDNYYKILEFIGNGANAYAYRCLCTSGNHRGIEFVLKIQYNLSNEMRRERFIRESAFLENCNHPSILRQFDRGIYRDEYPFIITNYMPETLKRKMDIGEVSFESKMKYSCQLLSAVAFLQSKNVLHRDIKPNNIFISDDNAVLGDFGLIKEIINSKVEESADDIELVNSTVMANLVGYAAMAKNYRTPELVNYANHMDELHIESDVFQVGLVLTELFSGKNPLRQTEKITDPLVLDKIGYIEVPFAGKTIHDTLAGMLQLDYHKRMTIQDALDRFTGIYCDMN